PEVDAAMLEPDLGRSGEQFRQVTTRQQQVACGGVCPEAVAQHGEEHRRVALVEAGIEGGHAERLPDPCHQRGGHAGHQRGGCRAAGGAPAIRLPAAHRQGHRHALRRA
ncbi:MAG: hypothetical protein ACK56I_29790, partial [bacterium]